MKIEHAHARILRETLARICRYGNSVIAKEAMQALHRYSEGVRPYCDHADQVLVAHEGASACLDCGTRFRVNSEPAPVVPFKKREEPRA